MTRHVKGSVTIFATQFEEASHALGYPPNVMALQFLHHMQPEIRKALNRQPTLDREDYEMVRKLAVEVDSNIYLERKEERTARPRTYTPIATAATTVRAEETTQQYGARHTGPRPPLTDTERNRRRTHNLCLYCRAKDHLVERCQLTKGQRRLNTTAYELDTATSIHHKNESD